MISHFNFNFFLFEDAAAAEIWWCSPIIQVPGQRLKTNQQQQHMQQHMYRM